LVDDNSGINNGPCVATDDALYGVTVNYEIVTLYDDDTPDVVTNTSLVIDTVDGAVSVSVPTGDGYEVCETVPADIDSVRTHVSDNVTRLLQPESNCVAFQFNDPANQDSALVQFFNGVTGGEPTETPLTPEPTKKPVTPDPTKASTVSVLPSTGQGPDNGAGNSTLVLALGALSLLAVAGVTIRQRRQS
jgi:hypothetical protein